MGHEAEVGQDMRQLNGFRNVGIFVGLAFAGWAGCTAIIGIGLSVTSLQNALIIHAIGAPIIFASISLLYFGKFGFTTALVTALTFTAFVMAMDFFIVALLIQGSLVMFSSVLGTWIPFALIFLSTYLTGTFGIKWGQVPVRVPIVSSK
jgi:hypothetical protein